MGSDSTHMLYEVASMGSDNSPLTILLQELCGGSHQQENGSPISCSATSAHEARMYGVDTLQTPPIPHDTDNDDHVIGIADVQQKTDADSIKVEDVWCAIDIGNVHHDMDAVAMQPSEDIGTGSISMPGDPDIENIQCIEDAQQCVDFPIKVLVHLPSWNVTSDDACTNRAVVLNAPVDEDTSLDALAFELDLFLYSTPSPSHDIEITFEEMDAPSTSNVNASQPPSSPDYIWPAIKLPMWLVSPLLSPHLHGFNQEEHGQHMPTSMDSVKDNVAPIQLFCEPASSDTCGHLSWPAKDPMLHVHEAKKRSGAMMSRILQGIPRKNSSAWKK